MKINGLNETNTQPGAVGMPKATDSVSKNIQNQIANAQKKLQDLSSNEDMPIEEKMKKRQEIQQEITNLNQQLRQHQIEQRKEKQTKSSSVQDLTGGTQTKRATSGEKSLGLSQASMQAMVSADSSLKQAKVQGSTATKMEGRAGILESEIKLDAQRGMDTQKKEEELADVQQKAQKATTSQLGILADATKTMQEAAQAEQQNGDAKAETAEKGDKGNTSEETEVSAEKNNEETPVRGIGTYTPVDVYL
ncbi:MAG: FlxA-like family protein [Lachnospiraceae bacterium]|nr:FlxA-like family protein [Lachnospiraceae bacterium]